MNRGTAHEEERRKGKGGGRGVTRGTAGEKGKCEERGKGDGGGEREWGEARVAGGGGREGAERGPARRAWR